MSFDKLTNNVLAALAFALVIIALEAVPVRLCLSKESRA
jgi:hypothetical protein